MFTVQTNCSFTINFKSYLLKKYELKLTHSSIQRSIKHVILIIIWYQWWVDGCSNCNVCVSVCRTSRLTGRGTACRSPPLPAVLTAAPPPPLGKACPESITSRTTPRSRPLTCDASRLSWMVSQRAVTAGDGHVMVWQLVEDSSRPLFRFSPPYRWCIWLCDSELTVMLQWPHTWAPCVTQSPRVVILKGRKRSIFVCVFWM